MTSLSSVDIREIAREVSKEIARDVAREVSRETVRETMLSLGIATGRQEDITDLQKDMAFIRKQRATAEKITMHVRLTLIALAVSGFAFVIWEGIKMALKGHV